MMIIDLDPTCYNNPAGSNYSKSLGDLYKAGLIHRGKVVLEIDSMGAPSTPIYPPNTKEDMAHGLASKRNFAVSIRPRYVDETLLQYSMTGLQGSFMFQLAQHVQRGIIRVVDQATGTPRTAKQILDYAVSSTPEAGVWV